MKERITNVSKQYQANERLLKSKLLGNNTIMKIYKTKVQLTALFNAETMTMAKKQEEELRIQKGEILNLVSNFC